MTKRTEATGIAGAMDYVPTGGYNYDPVCRECRTPFGEKASKFASTERGVGVVEFCSLECLDRWRWRGPCPTCGQDRKIESSL